MGEKNHNKHKGFTLIELSIVLVIIGLIVGGVLVGRDLIAAAAVRAQITQIEKYNQAVNTFRGKYGGIPGDLSMPLANQFGFFTPATCTGDGAFPTGSRNGNGLLEGAGVSAPLAGLMGENAIFWSDLAMVNLIDFTVNKIESCSASITVAATGISGFLPSAKIGSNGFIHAYSTNGSNWYLVAQFSAFTGGTSQVQSLPYLPVTTAYNLDKKVDDGNPVTGSVQAVYLTGSFTNTTLAPNAATDSASTCYNTTGPAYSITFNNGTGPNCALSFKFQ